MAFYRKIPVVIEAVQYDGNNVAEVLQWVENGEAFYDEERGLFIRTLEGDMKAKPGDYVVCGVAHEYYPCREDIFKTTYEILDDVYDVLDVANAIQE